MEDVEVSKRLKRVTCPYFALGAVVESSPRRWMRNGVLRTILAMWRYRIQYYLGASAESLYAAYYGDAE